MTETAYRGSVLDPWALLDLSRFGESRGDDALSELLGAFSREAAERVDHLGSAVAAWDLTRAGELAHGLRGSSMAVGATGVAECCADIEAAAREGDAGSLFRAATELGPLLEDALAALGRVFGGSSTHDRSEEA